MKAMTGKISEQLDHYPNRQHESCYSIERSDKEAIIVKRGRETPELLEKE